MPKKVKKGGGGKGGGKTEEEKLVYLQQRAQAEEEMARRKEEILALFLKDKLQKEQKNTAVNTLKLNEGWRTILRQTRATELREDVSILSQTFERQLDGLDSVVKILERDLQEAERQSAQVRQAHLQHLERLWAQQEKWLKFQQQQWENNLLELRSTFRSDRKQMLANSQQRQADRDAGVFTLKQQHEEMLKESYDGYKQDIIPYLSPQHRSIYDVVMSEKDIIEKKELNQTIRKEQQEKTIQLKNIENKNYIEHVDMTMKKLRNMQEGLIQLKLQLNSNKIKKEMVEQDLTATRKEMSRKTCKDRDQMNQAQTAARKQLTDITIQSNNATKKLNKVIDQGEMVLRVAELCRKLENEQETLFTSLPTNDLRQEGSVTDGEELAKEIPEFSELQQVRRSLNAALLHREALRKHRGDLSRGNDQLRLLLRQHLDAMTVNDAALDGPHALLTAHRAPTSVAPPNIDRRYTVIEAVHVVKHSL